MADFCGTLKPKGFTVCRNWKGIMWDLRQSGSTVKSVSKSNTITQYFVMWMIGIVRVHLSWYHVS